MIKEFEELQNIYEVKIEEWHGRTITNFIRKDNLRKVDLYDIFLDTLQILKNNNKLI